MPLRRFFQEGGLVEDDDEEVGPFAPDATDEEVPEPTSTKQASFLSQLLGASPEETRLVGEMEASAENVRAALRAARERIKAQKFNPPWFDIAAGLGQPTQTGAFGETMGNLGKVLSKYAGEKGEFERGQAGTLGKLDVAIAQAGDPVLKAQLELERIREQQRAKVLAGLTGIGARTPAELQMWNQLTAGLSQKEKERARKIKLGIISRAGQFTVRTVNGVPTLVGMDEQGNEIAGSQIPLTSITAQAAGEQATKTAQETGTGLGKQYNELQAAIVPARQRIDTLDQVGDLLKGLDTGALTPLKVKAAGVLQSLGLDVDENLGSEQAARAISNALALQMRNPQSGAGMPGNLSNSDRDFLATMVPGLAQTPEGRQTLIKYMKAMARRSLDIAKMARDYKREHGGFDEFFFDDLDQYAEEHPLLTSGLVRPGNVTPEQWYSLTGKQQNELLEKLKQPHAKGGRVRFQEGGRVITLSDGTQVEVGAGGEETTETQGGGTPPTLSDLRSMNDELLRMGVISGVGAGAGMGIGELLPAGRKGLSPEEHRVATTFEREGVDPVAALTELEQLQRAGTPATLMTEPAMRGVAETALGRASPTESRAALENLESQVEASRGRIEAQARTALNPQGSYFATQQAMTNDLYSNSKPLYEALYKKYPGVVESPELTKILESEPGKQAVAQAADLMQIEGLPIGKADVTGMVKKPSLQFLDYVKRGLDQMIETEEKSGPTTRGRALRDLRRRYRDELDAAAPGDYKAARQQYAGDLEVRDALEEGRIFNKFQPEELAMRSQTMSQAEKSAFRTGQFQRLMEVIDTSPPDVAKKLVRSPKMLASLKPFVDSPAAFDVLRTSLEKEVDLHASSRELLQAGKQQQLERLRGVEERGSMPRRVTKGILGAVKIDRPLNWANDLIDLIPTMPQKEAERTLQLLQTSDPAALATINRRFVKAKSKGLTGRRAIAAAIGAGLAGGAELLREHEME